jgi:hypothetical protein
MDRHDLLQLYIRPGLTPIPLKPCSKEPLIRRHHRGSRSLGDNGQRAEATAEILKALTISRNGGGDQ